MGITKDLGILDTAPHHHTVSKAAEPKTVDHKSGLHVQSRKDTTDAIPGEPDYVHPDDVGPISIPAQADK